MKKNTQIRIEDKVRSLENDKKVLLDAIGKAEVLISDLASTFAGQPIFKDFLKVLDTLDSAAHNVK